jgi:hypothetical protein
VEGNSNSKYNDNYNEIAAAAAKAAKALLFFTIQRATTTTASTEAFCLTIQCYFALEAVVQPEHTSYGARLGQARGLHHNVVQGLSW